MVSSWKLLVSTTCHVDGVDASTCAESGTPMLPPTSTGCPDASIIRPTSVVVVDLPLEPVIAMIGPATNDAANSSSPMTRTPRARAASQRPDIGRHAWTHDDQAASDGHVVGHRTETELDAERLQFVALGQIRLGVDQRHAAALLQDETAGRKAAAAAAHHRHMAPRDVVRDRRHRSLRVVRLNSAQTIAMIRKRVMTFGSLQPMSSKW